MIIKKDFNFADPIEELQEFLVKLIEEAGPLSEDVEEINDNLYKDFDLFLGALRKLKRLNSIIKKKEDYSLQILIERQSSSCFNIRMILEIPESDLVYNSTVDKLRTIRPATLSLNKNDIAFDEIVYGYAKLIIVINLAVDLLLDNRKNKDRQSYYYTVGSVLGVVMRQVDREISAMSNDIPRIYLGAPFVIKVQPAFDSELSVFEINILVYWNVLTSLKNF